MRNRAFASSERFLAFVCAGLAVVFCGAMAPASAATSPTLISVSAGSTRAVALESVSMRAEPFSLSSAGNFSPNDARTRITMFVMNLDLLAGETQNSLTADAEDAAHAHYPLKVEYVGQVPNFQGIYMVVMRLNDLMTGNLGDVLIRLNLHGVGSNRVRVAIGQIGGGPSDDPGWVGTPAPQTPPTPATPLTLAQYQAQYNTLAFPSDQDLRRFLEQASWGGKGDDSDFNHLRAVGIPAYINEQFNTPPQFTDNPDAFFTLSSDYPFSPPYPQFYPATSPTVPACDAICQRDFYTLYPLQKQFMLNALTQNDQLRQRVSFAFHKFIVAGGQQLNSNQPYWYAPYLQTIDHNSFGNYRTMLYEITLNPGMGEYLNMRGNSVINRANPTPNENYAREIMQLFSIGVDMLNQDGTPILDAQGNRIPAYDQNTIANLARVFTGWDIDFGRIRWTVDGTTVPINYLDPMVPNANQSRYDIAAKTLLPDINHPSPVTIPVCGPGTACTVGSSASILAAIQPYAIASLNTAIDNLFNHPNTGPYVCTQFIQQMVTSNPSPAYVGRCAAAFANNGSNVRGDMKAVITEILLDPEARGDVKTDPNYGHLREPVLLMTHLLRAFNATSDGVLVSNSPSNFTSGLGENVFNPPTVFSYFPSGYGLPGTTLVGPEFGILDTSSTYGRTNLMNTIFLANNGLGIPANGVNRPSGTQINYSSYQSIAVGATLASCQQLVDTLNAKLMHGTMSSQMNASIVATINAITNANATTQAQQRTQTAIYLVATSAQYQVER
jgi:uncharacterized protein (DUF1800 family)